MVGTNARRSGRENGRTGASAANAHPKPPEEARAHWRAAARGLPRREELLALPRQRFDAAEKRLSRALFANTQAHAKRLARIGPRLQARLLTQRIERAGDRIERTGARARDALSRIATQRRARLERLSGRLRPQTVLERIGRGSERLEGLAGRAKQALLVRVTHHRGSLAGQVQMLASLSYQSVLHRGFALVRDDSGRAIRSVRGMAPGQRLEIEFGDGRAGAIADGAAPMPEAPAGSDASRQTTGGSEPPIPPRVSRGRSSSGQGSLF